MAQCEEIIRSAYRRAGITAAGVPITAIQREVGIERLQGMYSTMLNGGLFGDLCDYYLSSGNYTAQEGQRIFKNTTGSVITIPATVVDKDTGKTRAPYDGSVVVVVDPSTNTPAIWLYNAVMAKWQNVSALVNSDPAPLSLEFEDQLKDILGAFLCDENGLPLTTVLAKNAGLAKLSIASRYSKKRKANKAEYF